MAGDTRERILDAAESIVIRDGVARLTVEAAAAEAQLSKGGVLYHFRTRDALVSSMVERMVEAFDADLGVECAADGQDGTPNGRYVRAYVRATVRPAQTPEDLRRERAGAAILAAMASEPQLLAPLREAFDRWQQRLVTDGVDPVGATVARLAADGLWLVELFGFAPLPEPLRSEVAAYLEGLGR
ncbi:MAG TPA: TetR family transcriptional regulator [Mycobacteriales bacterium]|jgi:AcrR family transcriptional regulator|nr:TetR family transcriptional regulator [Mycobacteriales bacterium]